MYIRLGFAEEKLNLSIHLNKNVFTEIGIWISKYENSKGISRYDRWLCSTEDVSKEDLMEDLS